MRPAQGAQKSAYGFRRPTGLQLTGSNDAANAACGTDNITAALARFRHRLVENVEDPALGIEAPTMVQLRQAMVCSA
jgi:hypothetical protein